MLYILFFIIIAVVINVFIEKTSVNQWVKFSGWAFSGIVICVLVWNITPPEGVFEDFYRSYWPTGVAIRQWAMADFEQLIVEHYFVNIPILAYLFKPFAYLKMEQAGWLFFIFGVLSVFLCWIFLSRMNQLNISKAGQLCFLFLVNGPLIYCVREGNTTHIILLLLVGAWYCVERKYDLIAGLLLGIAAVMKLPLLLYGVYFVFKRRWNIVLGGLGIILTVLVLSFVVFGVNLNQLWYEQNIKLFSKNPIPAFNVQSIDSFLLRIEFGSSGLYDWDPHQKASWHNFASTVILGGLFWLFFLMIKRGNEVVEYCLILALAIIASPLSWSHYYLLMLLPIAFWIGKRIPANQALMLLAILFISSPVTRSPLFSNEIMARTLASMQLLGGVIFFLSIWLNYNWQRVKENG